jgi:diguanylate cyclase (GGDEF)-like protein
MGSILIVEDDQAIAQMLKLILTKQGHELRHATNGEEALKLITQVAPDLIISDVMMPGLNGFDLAKQLQQSETTKTVPIIFVTALSQIEYVRDGLELGAVDYLTKPFRAMELEARVNTALRLKFAQDDLRKANAELTELALVDSLTNLRNMRYANEFIGQTLPHATRYHEPLSAIMLDLDFFKKVNDTYGHLVGNEVLQTLAKILKAQSRQSDVACRYGGEEFIIFCPNSSKEHSLALAERVRRTVAETKFPQVDWSLTVSLGVATYDPQRDTGLESLIARADEALYRAKHSGRNCVCEAT